MYSGKFKVFIPSNIRSLFGATRAEYENVGVAVCRCEHAIWVENQDVGIETFIV
jgi:hypothetical protein